MNERQALLNRWVDIAVEMLVSGAEIYRVEDTLRRLARAYTAVSADVFVITSLIVLTAGFEGDESYTVTRRLRAVTGMDMDKLEKLNELSRYACRKTPDSAELAERLSAISCAAPRKWEILLGSTLAAGAFALFFGGTLTDGALAVLFGLVIWAVLLLLGKLGFNRLMQYLISSIATGLLICLAGQIPALHMHIAKVIVGVIMLPIPGLAITNSLRDMLVGDTISGFMRFVQSLLEALALAGGFTFAIYLSGAQVDYLPVQDGVKQLIPALLGAAGFALMFNSRMRYLWTHALGALVVWAVYIYAELRLGLDVFWCSLIAAMCATLLSELCARTLKAPVTLFLIPFLVPLVPGSGLFYACSTLIARGMSTYAAQTLFAVCGISLGTGLAASLVSVLSKRSRT